MFQTCFCQTSVKNVCLDPNYMKQYTSLYPICHSCQKYWSVSSPKSVCSIRTSQPSKALLLNVPTHRRGHTLDWLIAKQRNLVSNLIRKAKKGYICEKIVNCDSSRELFRLSNQMMGTFGDTVLPSNIPPESLPDKFSEFFCW